MTLIFTSGSSLSTIQILHYLPKHANCILERNSSQITPLAEIILIILPWSMEGRTIWGPSAKHVGSERYSLHDIGLTMNPTSLKPFPIINVSYLTFLFFMRPTQCLVHIMVGLSLYPVTFILILFDRMQTKNRNTNQSSSTYSVRVTLRLMPIFSGLWANGRIQPGQVASLLQGSTDT